MYNVHDIYIYIYIIVHTYGSQKKIEKLITIKSKEYLFQISKIGTVITQDDLTPSDFPNSLPSSDKKG